MAAPRITSDKLKEILAKPGYGIPSRIKSSLQSPIQRFGSLREADRTGEVHDVESDPDHGSLDSKKLQVGYSGKVRIRVTFYRRRLADYGEECSRAVSEKALIDCLVYAGLIQGDSGREIWLEDGGQKKVGTNEEERTELELFYTGVDLENPWVKAKQNLAR